CNCAHRYALTQLSSGAGFFRFGTEGQQQIWEIDIDRTSRAARAAQTRRERQIARLAQALQLWRNYRADRSRVDPSISLAANLLHLCAQTYVAFVFDQHYCAALSNQEIGAGDSHLSRKKFIAQPLTGHSGYLSNFVWTAFAQLFCEEVGNL